MAGLNVEVKWDADEFKRFLKTAPDRVVLGIAPVLYEIINFTPRYSSQQDAMNHRRIQVIESPESIAITCQNSCVW